MKKLLYGILLGLFFANICLAATNFPGSLDSYSTKSSGDTIAEGHINDPQDAIEAIEAKIGTGASTPTDSNVLTGTGTGTSAWGKVELAAMVSGDLPLAEGGLGASLTNDPGGLLYCGASVMAILANDAAAGKILLSGGTSAPTWGTRVQMATGTYAGNNAATQGITGVGFQPKFVIILPQGTGVVFGWKTDQQSTYAFKSDAAAGGGTYYMEDHIVTLGADGFTVGDGTGDYNQFNATGTTYTYIAFTF